MKPSEQEMTTSRSQNTETLQLLRQYASLKDLIDGHKLRNPGPTTQLPPPPRPNTKTQMSTARYFKRASNTHSRYTLDRTKKLLPASPKPPPSATSGRHPAPSSSKTSWTSATVTATSFAGYRTTPCHPKVTAVVASSAGIRTPVGAILRAPFSTSSADHCMIPSHSKVAAAVVSSAGLRPPQGAILRAPLFTSPAAHRMTPSHPKVAAAVVGSTGLRPPVGSIHKAPFHVSATSFAGHRMKPSHPKAVASSARLLSPVETTLRVPFSVPQSTKVVPRLPSAGIASPVVSQSRKVVLGKLKTKVINYRNAAATKISTPKTAAAVATPLTLSAIARLVATTSPVEKSLFKFRNACVPPKGGSKSALTATVRRRVASKFKLVTSSASPKRRSGMAKVARKRPSESKYSWHLGDRSSEAGRRWPVVRHSQGGGGRSATVAVGKEPRRRVLLRSKYKLKMTSLLPGVEGGPSSRRAWQAKQFPLKHAASSTAVGRPSSFRSVRSKRGYLVTIGNIVYKSSQTKLTKSDTSRRVQGGIRADATSSAEPSRGQNRLVTVRGIKFVMDSNRKVLQRVSSDAEAAPGAPKTRSDSSVAARFPNLTRIDIGGETYLQRTPGVLVKTATNQTRTLANRFKNRSLTFLKSSQRKSKRFCLFYNKFGKCNKRENGACPYIHDAEKIAICKRFLRDGRCEVADCPFTHQLCPAKMPVCTFFLLGRCTHDACSYRHVNVNPGADICADFTRGHCPLAERCKKWHVDVCPQFSARGTCDRGDSCPLPHRRKERRLPALKRPTSPPESEGEGLPAEDGCSPKRLRLPSFISIAKTPTDSAVVTDPSDKSVSGGLRIRPDFLKPK